MALVSVGFLIDDPSQVGMWLVLLSMMCLLAAQAMRERD
jgi:hypothetical protein